MLKEELSKNHVQERILELIDKHLEGLTINDIALKLKLHRHTVSKYVYALTVSRNLYQRRIGKGALYYKTELKIDSMKE